MDLNTNDAYAALKIVDYRRFITARFLITFAIQMQSVVIGWQIYQITHDALSLGLIGMAEAIPFLGVTLFAGHIADLVDRKYIILLSNLVYFICTIALLLISTVLQPLLSSFGPMPIYMVIFITGLARGFLSPAQNAFAAQLVPKELFGNASTWNSVAWQVAEVGGPAIGGLLCGFWGFGTAYFFVMAFSAIGWLFFFFVKKRPVPVRTKDETIWESLSSGLKFVFGNQIILSAISLDMFAVFFGGAISVLPIFADQVLHTGAKGLGFLRAAPAVGAIIMSLVQAYWPPFKKAGRNLLICVFGFGVCIILFAISKSFYLTMFILMISGMFDNVSVIIRATIIQIYTPDEMRGRVSAVNGIFIGSSNELGSFESGLAAKLLGLIPSVIFGGSMTLAVVASVRKLAPKLRRLSF
ncbi:MAG: MFS transporter [Bacteroidota bacterium]|nr:MFS transporter [Bacteroidota bacterium]MDP4193686.1 MFS transporter [Bacteroidota bacterium]